MASKARLACVAAMLICVLTAGQPACAARSGSAPGPAPAAAGLEHRVRFPVAYREWQRIKVGLVTDMSGVDDRSFNAAAWQGIRKAVTELGVEGAFLESAAAGDYRGNLQRFVDQGYDLIIAVGFSMGIDTANAARANPDARFAIVDYSYPDCGPGGVPGETCGSATVLPNVLGLTFAVDQAAFLAGYLSAGMTPTGKIGTFGGMNFPAVTAFMIGYEQGAKHYNLRHGSAVQVLGWMTDPVAAGCGDGLFINSFWDADKGYARAGSLIDQGAGIVFPVAGAAGVGAARACEERSAILVGVDSDWYASIPDYQGVYLTSVTKNTDVMVYDAVRFVAQDAFHGGVYTGTAANGGVGLAPYHEFEDDVPASLRAELEQVRAGIGDGTIDTWPCP